MKNDGYDLNPIGRPVPSLNEPMIQGIDGLYENLNPDSNIRYVIDEVKYGGAVLKNTNDGLQMSDTWLRRKKSKSRRILKAVNGNKELAYKIFSALYNNQVQKVLSRADKDGVVTMFLLDSDVIEIGPWP